MIKGHYYINVIGTGTDSIKLHIVVERINSEKYEFQSIGVMHRGEVRKFQLNYTRPIHLFRLLLKKSRTPSH